MTRTCGFVYLNHTTRLQDACNLLDVTSVAKNDTVKVLCVPQGYIATRDAFSTRESITACSIKYLVLGHTEPDISHSHKVKVIAMKRQSVQSVRRRSVYTTSTPGNDVQIAMHPFHAMGNVKVMLAGQRMKQLGLDVPGIESDEDAGLRWVSSEGRRESGVAHGPCFGGLDCPVTVSAAQVEDDGGRVPNKFVQRETMAANPEHVIPDIAKAKLEMRE